MKFLKKLPKILLISAIVIYIGICSAMYFMQESFIFNPSTLPQDFTFKFDQPHEEIWIQGEESTINGVLFKNDSPNGICLFLHGNSGTLETWGTVQNTYTESNFDFLAIDYRGFGKSTGTLSSEKDLFEDVELAYQWCEGHYEKIVIIGYSIGTCPATMLASKHSPEALILQAPYHSIKEMVQDRFPVIPTFLLKYPLKTYSYLEKTTSPVLIFHGTNDQTIPYHHSELLASHLNESSEFITLPGNGHGGFHEDKTYLNRVKELLLSFESQKNTNILSGLEYNNHVVEEQEKIAYLISLTSNPESPDNQVLLTDSIRHIISEKKTFLTNIQTDSLGSIISTEALDLFEFYEKVCDSLLPRINDLKLEPELNMNEIESSSRHIQNTEHKLDSLFGIAQRKLEEALKLQSN